MYIKQVATSRVVTTPPFRPNKPSHDNAWTDEKGGYHQSIHDVVASMILLDSILVISI